MARRSKGAAEFIMAASLILLFLFTFVCIVAIFEGHFDTALATFIASVISFIIYKITNRRTTHVSHS